MIDIMIPSSIGKLHAVYHKSSMEIAPLAVILSGNPKLGYGMNDRVTYAMFRAFMDAGFSTVRFDYRGVNDSTGVYGSTTENVLDIATVIDWIQDNNEESNKIWLAGYNLGSWYVLQSMMRRPEVSGFALVSPDSSISDFGFLSPRPNRGLLLQGGSESDAAKNYGNHLKEILKKQARINLESITIKGATDRYSSAQELRQLYNDLKAYVGKEESDKQLLDL